MVHRLSSNERAEERGREGVEWPGASANNGTESQGPARPLRINRKGLNKFSPLAFWINRVSDTLLYLCMLHMTLCPSHEKIPVTALHTLSAEWSVIVHLNDIENVPSWWLRPFQKNMCEVFIIIRITEMLGRVSGQIYISYYSFNWENYLLLW